jgi:hypothetical protein
MNVLLVGILEAADEKFGFEVTFNGVTSLLYLIKNLIIG